METRKLSRWSRVFIGLAWLSMGLGGIQMYVGGAQWTVVAPGFALLLVFALPEWLHQLEMARRARSNS